MSVKRDGGRRVTLKDIADELGVAASTVSNAYNRPDQLSAALREKILATAAELGYTGPDPGARSLRRGVTNTLGVVYPSELSYAFTDPAAALFLRGIAIEAEREGYALLLVGGPPEVSSERAPVRPPVAHANVDGFVIHCFADDDPLLAAALERNLPAVMVDNRTVEGRPFVAIDDEGGAGRAAEHVLELGHERIGIISLSMGLEGDGGIVGVGRQERAAYAPTRARLRGYRRAVEGAGLDWEHAIAVFESPDNTVAAGRAAAAALLDADPDVTAVLAMSDQFAIGVLAYAAERGIEVPDELAVVGYDDAPGASHSRPPLTTVRQPHIEKGRNAARLLIEMLRGEREPTSVTLPTELVVRGSTGPRAASG